MSNTKRRVLKKGRSEEVIGKGMALRWKGLGEEVV
jgi:hypothetical protein